MTLTFDQNGIVSRNTTVDEFRQMSLDERHEYAKCLIADLASGLIGSDEPPDGGCIDPLFDDGGIFNCYSRLRESLGPVKNAK
jgi:hypothetical protein